MARSKAFQDLLRAARIARYCNKHGLSTDQGIASLAQAAERRHAVKRKRREVLAGFGAATKLIYLALRNITKEWKMPPVAWRAARTQFAVLFGERFTASAR